MAVFMRINSPKALYDILASYFVSKCTMNFRYDINGLRAFAVLAVVLFHFSVPGFSAGFLGVDVFFVISGYLMTAIVLRNIDQNRFSLVEYYLARSRRIIPALAVLCLALLLLGYWILIPKDYELLGKHAAASIGFISNETYLAESGYFDALSHEKLLLHTWSLSVEWQFYLIFPLIILFLAKLGNVAMKLGYVAILILSFVVAMYQQQASPDEAYFRFYTRVWEMMLGGLVVLFPYEFKNQASQKILYYVMLALLILSMCLIGQSTPWPGYLTLLPVLATMGVIYAWYQQGYVFNNAAFQWLGARSYSIYLWHWPLSALLVLGGLDKQPEWQAAGILASLVAGNFSYLYVEQVAAKARIFRLPGYKGLSIFVLIFVLVWLAGRFVFVKDGFPERIVETDVDEMLVMPTRANGWCFNDFDKQNKTQPSPDIALCTLLKKDTAAKKGLLFGDSFAAHYEPMWKNVLQTRDVHLDAMTTNWCYPSINQEFIGKKTHRSYQQCQINRQVLEDKVVEYDFVILAGHWQKVAAAGRMADIEELVELISSKGLSVILMASPTIYDVDVLKRYRFSQLNGLSFDLATVSKQADGAVRQLNESLKEIADKRATVYMVTRQDLFGDHDSLMEISEDNIPYSLDGRHLSVFGAMQAASSLADSAVFLDLINHGTF
jgi:peptidoglycan/LPS O-acetylase OafA/YrhL